MSERHLTESMILTCLRKGLDCDRSRKLLIHLDRGCYACSQLMRAVASGDEARCETANGLWTHPVVLALWRWICVLRGDPQYPTGVTPPHIFWAERLPQDPTAFGRVVIEEAVRQALSPPGQPLLWAPYEKFLRTTLSHPELEELGTNRWFDLRALSAAYYANPFHQFDIIIHTGKVLKYLKKGTDDPEVRGTAWLYLALSTGLPVAHLSKAESYLLRFIAGTPSPGHHADLLVAQARGLINRHKYYDAYQKLLQAREIVPEPCIWLKFWSSRKLGCLEGWNLVPNVAGQQKPSGYLLEAEILSRELPGWLGKSLHATGQAALIARRHGPARDKLREAMTAYREEGDRKGILECLGHLHSISVATGDFEALEYVRSDLREIVSGDSAFNPKERHLAFTLARELDDFAFVCAAIEVPA